MGLLNNFTAQELEELQEDHSCCPMSWTSTIFALTTCAHDERGYGSVNPGTDHRKAAKKPRTTFAPAVVSDHRSQQPSGSQPGAGLPPHEFCDEGYPRHFTSSGASQSNTALGRLAPHESGALLSDQGGQEETSRLFEYEAPSQPIPLGPSTSGRDSMGSLSQDEVRRLRDRVYAVGIALGLGPDGQATTQDVKAGALEVLRQDVDALGGETRELHGRVDCRVPASALIHEDPTPAAPVVQRTQPRFEEVSSHIGLPPSDEKGPADHDTA
ncbi:Hypothetical protein PHPALM_14024 [Phytophthora palmivora]|uniref:Uncharacterized protein n=1 Tax=Phytophthora palmivora TaxID=4796 RepID=A0A2P4XVT0_9STRA|nr:Hypothetical protein PHPALM_14024 [Phytophthora palmivora]